ncbi:sodium/glutamate symporter [Levyella massiliensis]|uniref:sodium/glutamate symporter n=1 Tax=Levyella massiliensis TaxID=938289 RepID=UPI00399A2219
MACLKKGGRFVRSKVTFLVNWSIPEAVVGGTLFAILTLILHSTGMLEFKFDTKLQSFFMRCRSTRRSR